MKSNMLKALAFAGITAMSLGAAHAQGPLKAMHFPGNGVLTPSPTATTNSYVDLGTAIKDSLATTNFTIELWVKMGATNSVNPVIIGNKDWASGSNTGIVLSYYASTDASSGTGTANSLRFNFRPANGTRVDYDISFPAATAGRWNHVAITVNRSGNIQAYLNGIATGQSYVAGTSNIAADAGKSIAGTLPMRLGTDGKLNGYRAPFNGDLDEVRIWKKALTAAEIRQAMCHKLTGSESDLLAYYRMDDNGTTVANMAAATTGSFNGTLVNSTERVASGAPVGDTSVQVYTTSWAGQSLQLATTDRGVFTVDSFSNAGSFLHLYQVNAVPDSTNGLTPFGNNNVYFGTFASADSFVYLPKYNYSNYTAAQTFENTISFFSRRFNADPSWLSKTNLYTNAATNLMRLDTVAGTRQFFLANFLSTCNAPTMPVATNIQANGAQLSWTSGGSALWNIEYGPSGFTQGTGTYLPGINTNPYNLSGLTGNTTYDYYVKDTCVGIGASAWAGPYTFTTTPDWGSYGAGYALKFNGTGVQNSPVDAVNLGTALKDSLATTNFTVEMWVKVGATNTGNPPLIADKDYVSGANTGICLTYTASTIWGDAVPHVFRFNFKPTGGTRRDYDVRAANEFTWNHYAFTVDRSGFIKGYVNGVYKPSTYASGQGSIAADSGKTIAGIMPLYLGTDGTGNYRVPFNGHMDEVRIWKQVRTEEEIRQHMCQKLSGNEEGLLAYYRFDEPSGTVVYNNAAATIGNFNATVVNTPGRVVSPAPIGDTSAYVYPAGGWANTSLSITAAGKGMLTVDSVANSAIPGVHVYRVDGVPNFAQGIAGIGATDRYFGVFTADNAAADYRVHYNYANYPAAVSNNTQLHLYNRKDNAATLWAQLPAQNNTAANQLTDNGPLGVRQYLLADFTQASCPAPSAINADVLGFDNATLSWTSSAALHHTRYGSAGFDMASAADTTVTVNSRQLSNLASNSLYEFYVQDSCGNNSKSAWVGPYFFSTKNACPQVQGVFADSTTTTSLVVKWTDEGLATTNYEVSWGMNGTFTDPTTGILQVTNDERLSLTGLQLNTAYDFYIRTNCSGNVSNSGWAGPFTFSTDSTDVEPPLSIPGITGNDQLRVYPNPATDKIYLINAGQATAAELMIYNNLGVCVFHAPFRGGKQEISTGNLSAGMYHIVLQSATGRLQKTFVITR